MNILESQKKILEFCVVPRTSVEIVEMLGMQRTPVYLLLRNLISCKELIKKGNNKNRVKPAVFIITAATQTNESIKMQTNNFYAHNPFGLKL
jgi:predicted transcriptional regulator